MFFLLTVREIPSAQLNIPLDEGCQLVGSYNVYIDDEDVIYDVALNQTNAGNNNNKFYRIQLLENAAKTKYTTWTRWGRVGEHGTTKGLGDGSFVGALKQFEAKFKDKTGNKWGNRLDPPKAKKYVFLGKFRENLPRYGKLSHDRAEKNYDPIASTSSAAKTTAESQLPEPVQHLMQLIFNQQYMKAAMAELDYDAEKLPLGKLSVRTIEQAYLVLKVCKFCVSKEIRLLMLERCLMT